MKKVWLVLAAGLLVSSAIAQEGDSMKPIMTADEACKLAYAWTGFDKNRPADLIPQCRAELVDSGYLKQPGLRSRIGSDQLWKASFDTVRVARLGTPDSVLREQRPRRCEVFLGSRDARLVLVTLYELGRDTANVPPPEKRDVKRVNELLISTPTPLDLQEVLSKALCQPFRSRLVECICVQSSEVGSEMKGPYWRVVSHAVESERMTIGGRFSGRQSTCIDATDGKFRCGLSVSGEGPFLPDKSDICRLALEWSGFYSGCFKGSVTNCRAIQMDGSILERQGWKRPGNNTSAWVAIFDTVILDSSAENSRSGGEIEAYKCELFFDPPSEALLMVKVMALGYDTILVAPPPFRRFGLDSGNTTNEPSSPNIYCLLREENCRRMMQKGLVEMAHSYRPGKFGVGGDAYWLLFRHGEVMVPHQGISVGGELTKYDIERGSFIQAGRAWRECPQ